MTDKEKTPDINNKIIPDCEFCLSTIYEMLESVQAQLMLGIHGLDGIKSVCGGFLIQMGKKPPSRRGRIIPPAIDQDQI